MKPPPCDHIRHQWRGVDLPCATPGCVDGLKDMVLIVVTHADEWPYMGHMEPQKDRFIRENWDGGWGWRLA